MTDNKLTELADEIYEAGVAAARGAGCKAPWYHAARADMAHAANCFAAAAALRARAQQEDEANGQR